MSLRDRFLGPDGRPKSKNGIQPKPNRPPVIGGEPVVVICGHTVLLELFPQKQDKYRDQRRINLAAKLCPACRKEADAKVAAEAAERRRLKAAAWREKQPKTSGKRRIIDRLPDGSSFSLKYDGVAVMWTGVLTIPFEGEVFTFKREANAVNWLTRDLDAQWRLVLDKRKRTAEALEKPPEASPKPG